MTVQEKPELRFKPEAIRTDVSSGSGESSRLFLVDEHCLLREGLRSFIERQKGLTVVGEANNTKAAYRLIATLRPDLVIMDVSIGGWSGIRSLERICQELPGVKVLAFTGKEDQLYLREVFEAGACGYVLKCSPGDEILKAIRNTLKGGAHLDPRLGDGIRDLLTKKQDSPSNGMKALSERERIVLKLVSQGYANKEVALQLGISIKTVETHKARAMNKLALDSRVDLIHYAMKHRWLTEK